MKISYNWLKTLIDINRPAEDISSQLTAAGLEVEGIEQFETMPGGLRGLVVGEVLTCAKHPGADRLSVTTVDIGNGTPLSIVCGAPNVAAGQKVVIATVGTQLFPKTGEPFEIKKSKIRGEISEGMICAEDEIGLGTSHEGIMILAPGTVTGTPAAEHFNITSDTILEIGLTPNRSDAASHLGVARDLAAILNTADHTASHRVVLPGLDELPVSTETGSIKIHIQNPEACKRYSGVLVKGLKVAESPAWLVNRLRAIGVRPINNVVDITNFVLHELGQPLHAFDAGKIQGQKINVRTAAEGETVTTLDGVHRLLKSNDLVICDEKNPLCIAGILGGSTSGVTESTTDVFFESAYFEPAFVRRTAKHHALKTDASFRFERGTDPEMTTRALVRAVNLVLEVAGGSVAMAVTDVYPEKLAPYKVAFSYYNCTELIGKEIDRNLIKQIILSLGIVIDSEGSDGLLLLVPRYKTDVTREVDVIEEVLRIYGYNHVEANKHISYSAPADEKNTEDPENRVGTYLEHNGFSEIMGLSLTKETYYPGNPNTVKVLNPLSADLNVLRANMLFGGLEALAYNINRKNTDLKFFEAGRTYELKGTGYVEQKHLALYLTGRLFNPNPYNLNQTSDLSFLKSVVEGLLYKCGVKTFKSAPSESEDFDYGLSYSLNNKPLADMGAVSRQILKKFEIGQPVYYARIEWDTLVKAFQKKQVIFEEISKFPSVRRDLALLIDKSVKYQQVEELAMTTEKKLLKEVNLFDIYEDEKLGNKRSYAVSFTLLNNESTLTDKQIDGVMEKLIAGYKEKLGAELR